MLKTIRSVILTSFVFALSLVAFSAATQSVSAQTPPPEPAKTTDAQESLCKGANTLKFGAVADDEKAAASCAGTSTSASKLDTLIKNIVNIFSIIVGIVAVIMIIYGGFRYITSGGDSGNVGNAKNTILYAIIGLVIVALAQFIVRFVLNQSTNLTTTTTPSLWMGLLFK